MDDDDDDDDDENDDDDDDDEDDDDDDEDDDDDDDVIIRIITMMLIIIIIITTTTIIIITISSFWKYLKRKINTLLQKCSYIFGNVECNLAHRKKFKKNELLKGQFHRQLTILSDFFLQVAGMVIRFCHLLSWVVGQVWWGCSIKNGGSKQATAVGQSAELNPRMAFPALKGQTAPWNLIKTLLPKFQEFPPKKNILQNFQCFFRHVSKFTGENTKKKRW